MSLIISFSQTSSWHFSFLFAQKRKVPFNFLKNFLFSITYPYWEQSVAKIKTAISFGEKGKREMRQLFFLVATVARDTTVAFKVVEMGKGKKPFAESVLFPLPQPPTLFPKPFLGTFLFCVHKKEKCPSSFKKTFYSQ